MLKGDWTTCLKKIHHSSQHDWGDLYDPFNRKENLHFDNGWAFHMGSENYESVNSHDSLFLFETEGRHANAKFLSSREEISQSGIEPPTSPLRFGYLSIIIQ